MAYTVTTLSGNSTLVGTSGADQISSAGTASKKIKVNAFEGLDTLTIDATVASGTVGMGGGIDAVTVSAVAEDVSITLGDAADTFTASAAADGLTVGGQGGSDTFTFTAAVLNSRFSGGKGIDKFVSTTADIGTKVTIVGGSENDVIGTSSARFQTGTSAFINGQVGADSIFLDGTAGMTVHGGSEADTINNSAAVSSCLLSGDNGADTIVDVAGVNTINGGGGADTITAGAGADTITGGLGTDDFIMSDVVTAAAGITVDVITDFTVGSDDIGNYGVADIETLTVVSDLVEAGNAASVASGNFGAAVTKVTGAYDLGTSGTGSVLTLGSSTAFTTTTVATALKSGGDLELTAGAAFGAADGFIVFYDDNIDTYAAVVTTAGGVSDNAVSSDFVVTNLTKLKGLTDATTITSADLLAFTA